MLNATKTYNLALEIVSSLGDRSPQRHTIKSFLQIEQSCPLSLPAHILIALHIVYIYIYIYMRPPCVTALSWICELWPLHIPDSKRQYMRPPQFSRCASRLAPRDMHGPGSRAGVTCAFFPSPYIGKHGTASAPGQQCTPSAHDPSVWVDAAHHITFQRPDVFPRFCRSLFNLHPICRRIFHKTDLELHLTGECKLIAKWLHICKSCSFSEKHKTWMIPLIQMWMCHYPSLLMNTLHLFLCTNPHRHSTSRRLFFIIERFRNLLSLWPQSAKTYDQN